MDVQPAHVCMRTVDVVVEWRHLPAVCKCVCTGARDVDTDEVITVSWPVQ